MRIGLLVFPALGDSFYAQERRLLYTQRLEPSVLYVAPSGCDVVFIDDNRPRPDVDLYLCSVYTRGWAEFTRFAGLVGRDKVIAGGYHPTALPQEAFRHAHKVVVGYCGNIDQVLERPAGIYNGLFAFTRMNRDLIDQRSLCQVYPDIRPDYVVGSMVSSVGCPFDCDFCSTPNMSGRKMRVSPLDYVEAEIADLVGRGVQSVFVRDESFATNSQLPAIADRFKGKFKMVYSFGTGNVMGGREDLVAHLGQCGWHSLNFGLEDIGVAYRKNRELRAATENCRRHGVGVVLSFIVNDDGKTQAEALANYQALYAAFCDLLPSQVCANFLMPMPGSGIWPKYQHRIREEDFEKYDSKTPVLSTGELASWHQRAIVAVQLAYYYSETYRRRVRNFECGDTLHQRVEELKVQFGFADGSWNSFLELSPSLAAVV